jgi:hypothetical protein
MVKYVTSIQSKHSQKDVFEYLSDFSSAADWDPGIQSATRVGTPTIEVGSRFDLVSRFLGKKVNLSYYTVEIKRPEKFVVRADAGSFYSEDTITVDARAEGCLVRYQAILEFKWPQKLFGPLFQLVFNRIGAGATKGLVNHLNRLSPPVRED